ncbi:MAG: arginine N-succinyltransferase [Rubrivivax sp.]|jgi:arginine N-succinyltransferase|nr:arginine N-succinyltransferase [Rubrivivax sp.]
MNTVHVHEIPHDTPTPELSSFGGGPSPAFDDPAPRHWLATDAHGQPLARLSLARRIGWRTPHAWYRLGWAVHSSPELQLFGRQRTLLLGHDLTGADALGGWALAPALREASAEAQEGAQEVWSALLDAAWLALAAADTPTAPCIAELPGLADDDGQSPFWRGLGQHFHHHGLAASRQQHGAAFDSLVAELLPRHLVYASFLSPAAQAAMGQCASSALPLRRALQQRGFCWRQHITVTDGGAVMEWEAPDGATP